MTSKFPCGKETLFQTTLGKTISSEDSSLARGAGDDNSTSPQQLLLFPAFVVLGATSDDLARTCICRGIGALEDEPDHRTTELGSILGSERSLSAVKSNENKH